MKGVVVVVRVVVELEVAAVVDVEVLVEVEVVGVQTPSYAFHWVTFKNAS